MRMRGCGCLINFSHASFARRISDVVDVVLMSCRPFNFMKYSPSCSCSVNVQTRSPFGDTSGWI